jgi:transposase
MFGHLMAHLRAEYGGPGRPRTRPDRLRADKAYSTKAIRAHLRARGITAVIPEPADQQGHRRRRGFRGGRPPAIDAEDYQGRNVVGRSFNLFQQWRGLATRYDKLALTYRGGAVLRAITIWLKALLGDMPYTNLLAELANHAVGRSPWWALVQDPRPSRRGRPAPGGARGSGPGWDSPMFGHLRSHLRVHGGPAAPSRTRPERLRTDKAYSSRAIRAHLRARKITAVIPKPTDQQGHRRR